MIQVEDVMHTGQRDVFLPGYKSSARKKIVKFGVAVSCGKKFAHGAISLRRCGKKVMVNEGARAAFERPEARN